MNLNPEIALSNVLFGYEDARRRRLIEQDLKLAHYTSAESALNILDSRELWLRPASLMDDFSEIDHGAKCVLRAVDGDDGQRLQNIFDLAHPGVWDDIMASLHNVLAHAHLSTFMTSLCEHALDDLQGSLAMWRAYGGRPAGAAIVFNTEVLDDDAVDLRCFSSPVFYGGGLQLGQHFKTLVDRVEANSAVLKALPRKVVHDKGFAALQFAALSTKHSGFAEEKEWRLIHLPAELPHEHVHESVQCIGGLPQVVFKLPIHRREGMNMPLTLDRVLHRIIIGPTQYPQQVRSAFVMKLGHLGIKDPGSKVVSSNIPLRHWS